MVEKTQLKAEGLAFGHSLQSTFKTVIMYSVEHPAAARATEQMFDSLNKILSKAQQFTFGFLNKRVLINELLTDDTGLSQLESEFFRRGIGAITFSAGITLAEFKRGLAIVGSRPKIIEEKGGIELFLRQHPLVGMRVLPAITPEGEDTVLQMNPESYLMAQGILGPGKAGGGPGLESLLRFVGMDSPAGFAGGPKEALDLAGKATQAALMMPGADPRESLRALTRMLQEFTPNLLLSTMPSEKRAELAGRPPEAVAESLVEDLTADLAGKQLTNDPARAGVPAVQEQVVQILMRGMQATHVAEHILQKLSHVIEEAHLPPEVFNRIRQEITWVQLDPQEKYAQLMRIYQYDDQDFQRLIKYLHEAMAAGRVKDVSDVVEHFLKFLDSPPDVTRSQEVAKVLQILPIVTSSTTMPLLRGMAIRLSKELLDGARSDMPSHQQVVKCLTAITHSAAGFEDFAVVHKIGLDVEASQAKDAARHRQCCGEALENVLPMGAFERVIELYVAKRDDPGWAKFVASLAKWLGPKSGEVVFSLLEKENSAANRLRLVRMCAPLLGGAAMEAARRRLSDERWYVVRNACTVLGEVCDPDLPAQLRVALRHSDDRVQQAAVTSMIKCKAAGRGAGLAEALPHLKGQALETALDELSFMKETESVTGLRDFVLAKTGARTGLLEKAVRALSAIGTPEAIEVLGKVLSDTAQPPSVRNLALTGLGGNPQPSAKQVLAEFVRVAPNDPLAIQGKKFLAPSVA